MPRDYRRLSNSARVPTKRRPSKSCVWWLVVGVALGVVVANVLSPRQSDPVTNPELAAKPDKPAVSKPNFRFEEILSDSEVQVGSAPPLPPSAPRPQPPAPAAQEPAQTTTVTPPAAAVPRAGSGTYVVQVGSFGRAADAERLRAQLELLGISTSVQAATLADGRVTHRVRTGGYASRQEAEKVRSVLQRHGKDSLSIPIR